MNCNQTEVSMNVISNRKKMLQSKNKNVDNVCTCFLIWLQKLKQKAPTDDKGTFVAANAQHVKQPRGRFTSRRRRWTMSLVQRCRWPPCLCCTAKWMKKWIVIFFFVFCVFVECVLINMSNSNIVWFSSFRVQANNPAHIMNTSDFLDPTLEFSPAVQHVL